MNQVEKFAFPVYGICRGLTKREWFAGMALQGLLINGGKFSHFDGVGDDEYFSKFAYKYADAMLNEKNQGEG